MDSEVLQLGSHAPKPVAPRRTTRVLRGALALAVAVVVVGFAVAEIAPSLRSTQDTGLQLLMAGPDGLDALDVDSGRITGVSGDSVVDEVKTLNGVVVLQIANEDRLFADLVMSPTGSETMGSGAMNQIGHADRVFADPHGGVWLVIDAVGNASGGVSLTSTQGGWRSRVFTLPARRTVVGAATDGLVTLKGRYRDRALQIWDPQLQEVVRDLGLVTGVQGTTAESILVSRGCLSKGCEIALVDAVTGASTEVALPTGWIESGPPLLRADGATIVQTVSGVDGTTALATGSPGEMTVNTDISPESGSSVFEAEDGWLVSTAEDGDVVLVRDSEARAVDVPPGLVLVGVTSLG